MWTQAHGQAPCEEGLRLGPGGPATAPGSWGASNHTPLPASFRRGGAGRHLHPGLWPLHGGDGVPLPAPGVPCLAAGAQTLGWREPAQRRRALAPRGPSRLRQQVAPAARSGPLPVAGRRGGSRRRGSGRTPGLRERCVICRVESGVWSHRTPPPPPPVW